MDLDIQCIVKKWSLRSYLKPVDHIVHNTHCHRSYSSRHLSHCHGRALSQTRGPKSQTTWTPSTDLHTGSVLELELCPQQFIWSILIHYFGAAQKSRGQETTSGAVDLKRIAGDELQNKPLFCSVVRMGSYGAGSDYLVFKSWVALPKGQALPDTSEGKISLTLRSTLLNSQRKSNCALSSSLCYTASY